MIFRVLLWIFNLLAFLSFSFFGYILYEDRNFVNYIIEQTKWEYIAIILAVYILVFVLATFFKFFGGKKNIVIKKPSGEVEIKLETICNIANTYLKAQEIIRNSKIKITKKCNSFVLDAEVECNQTESMNEILNRLKEELSEYIVNMIGVAPKKINMKISKINIVSTYTPSKPEESEIVEKWNKED